MNQATSKKVTSAPNPSRAWTACAALAMAYTGGTAMGAERSGVSAQGGACRPSGSELGGSTHSFKRHHQRRHQTRLTRHGRGAQPGLDQPNKRRKNERWSGKRRTAPKWFAHRVDEHLTDCLSLGGEAFCGNGANCRDRKTCKVEVDGCGNCFQPVEVVLEHIDRGSFNSPDMVELVNQPWKVVDNLYPVRSLNFGGTPPTGSASRAYFTFSLAEVSGNIVGAKLRVAQADMSFDSPDPSEDIQLFDVSTSSAELTSIAPGSSGADIAQLERIFDDLGSNPISDPFSVFAAAPSSMIEIPLTDVTPLSTNSGSWSVGVDLRSFGGAPVFGFEQVWRGSQYTGPTELVLSVCTGTTTTKVPGEDSVPADESELVEAPSTIAAPFVDTGHYVSVRRPGLSFRFQSPTQEHQSYLTGNRTVLDRFDIENRSYFVFDVTAVTETPTTATLRLWVPSPTVHSMLAAYASEDASETLTLFSVATAAADVMSAPFMDFSNSTLDVPIFNDLGDGVILGSRAWGVADTTDGLVPNPFEDQSVDCALDTVACGQFVDYPLTPAALAEIAATSGEWVIGMAMTTIDASPNSVELIGSGTFVDLDPAKQLLQFRSPAPQLLITPGPLGQGSEP